MTFSVAKCFSLSAALTPFADASIWVLIESHAVIKRKQPLDDHRLGKQITACARGNLVLSYFLSSPNFPTNGIVCCRQEGRQTWDQHSIPSQHCSGVVPRYQLTGIRDQPSASIFWMGNAMAEGGMDNSHSASDCLSDFTIWLGASSSDCCCSLWWCLFKCWPAGYRRRLKKPHTDAPATSSVLQPWQGAAAPASLG